MRGRCPLDFNYEMDWMKISDHNNSINVNVTVTIYDSAVVSKNEVFANIKHSRYFHWTYNFWSIHYCGKKLYVHVFDMVDNAFLIMEEH